VRPTSDVDLGQGSPRKKYRFRYAPGVPQAIAKDLKQAVQAGGALPVMQLVCGRLYNAVMPGGTAAKKSAEDQKAEKAEEAVDITFAHYRGLGGVQGQITGHLNDVLDRMSVDSEVSAREIPFEARRWRRLLLKLAKAQVDGTVTTEMIPVADFIEDAEKAKCIVPARKGIDFLIKKENRILRDVTVYNAAQREEIPCLALGHDAIGLALAKGLTSKDVGERSLQSIRSLARVGAAGLILSISFLNLAHIFSGVLGWDFFGAEALITLNVVGFFYTGVIVLIAIMPVEMFVRIFEAGATVYGVVGFSIAKERLEAIAEELRQGQSKEKIDQRTLLMLTDRNALRRQSKKKNLRKPRPVRSVKIDPADAPWLRSALTFLNVSLKSIDRMERVLRSVAQMFPSSPQDAERADLKPASKKPRNTARPDRSNAKV
jgi:hypothetical protein